MIKAYPEMEIVQKTIINGETEKQPIIIIFSIHGLIQLIKLIWVRILLSVKDGKI